MTDSLILEPQSGFINSYSLHYQTQSEIQYIKLKKLLDTMNKDKKQCYIYLETFCPKDKLFYIVIDFATKNPDTILDLCIKISDTLNQDVLITNQR